MPTFSTILFDLDGTLIDHFAAIHRSHSHTMRQLGLPAPIVDSHPVISGDNLAEPLKAWLEDKTETTAVWAARGIGLTDIDRMTTTRIAALLRLFGWVRHESKRDGVKVNLWFRPDAAPAGAK